MLMESQCIGGGGAAGGHIYPFRERKASCGTSPPISPSAGRLPAFARFSTHNHHGRLHHTGPANSITSESSSTSSTCSTPTRSGATTPTQQSYSEMMTMTSSPSSSSTTTSAQLQHFFQPRSLSFTPGLYQRSINGYQQCYAPDDYRRRSNTLQSNRQDKRWPKRDMGPQFELRCCIDPEILRVNVDRQYYFEDKTVEVNGSVFHKRSDYGNLLSVVPKSKFNGIHIKMEDDCPQGGDDVRLCLLKSLGAHNLREIPCVQCKAELKVYERYPLIDGVFYISPVSQFGPKTEISLDGRRFYLQQLCVRCLWSDWSCKDCGKDEWFDGKSFVLGTLYYYDILSSGRCCPTVCQSCKQPLGVRDQLATQLANGNYATINEQLTCTACGASKFHLVRDIKTCHVSRAPSFCEQ